MKALSLALVCALTFSASVSAAPLAEGAPSEPELRSVMRRVFDWQVAHPWSAQHPIEHRWGERGWVHGAFLTGVMEAYRSTGDAAYLAHARAKAVSNGWKLGARPRHADDHVIGQTYLELYELEPASEKLSHTQTVFDGLLKAEPTSGREFWSWCDALFMSPPTWAKLSRATADPRYLQAMDAWYWDSHDAFFDSAESLFYRDERFVAPADGKKVFWSRGNGWVLAGLARLIEVLPPQHPTLPRYEALFQRMATRLVELQPEDGLWRADLLSPKGRHGEASGSAFFCYALAWGINRGLLTDPSLRARVERTWAALVGCVREDGMLGWVQPIGFAPDAYSADTYQEYGAGAFLAAGGQMLKLRAAADAQPSGQ